MLGQSERPTEVAVTIAVAAASTQGGRDWAEGWVPADLVRGMLKRLGFDYSTQQVASWLKRMAAEDAPWVDRRRCPWDHCWEYRVTHYGANDVDNKLGGVKVHRSWALRPLSEREAQVAPPR